MSLIFQYYPQVKLYIEYLQFEKRYSKNTIEAYQNDFDQFFIFLIDQYNKPTIAQILPVYIRSWLATLKSDSISSKSINRKVSALKSFFKYQLKLGVIEINPMNTISSPKIGKRLPEFVQEAHLDTLFNEMKFSDDFKGSTDRLVLLLFYETGMRVSELVSLKEIDVDVANCNLKVLGKGNKERLIPLSKEIINLLEKYISSKPVSNLDIGMLFVNEKGNPLNRHVVYKLVNHYLSLVTTIHKKSPHILRHSFATHLMNNGADLNAVKELLGHSSLASTQVYTHNSIEKLKEVFRKAHPKS